MNLYSVLEKGFPKDKSACAIETHDGLYYSWSDLEGATAKLANLLKSLKMGETSWLEMTLIISLQLMLVTLEIQLYEY